MSQAYLYTLDICRDGWNVSHIITYRVGMVSRVGRWRVQLEINSTMNVKNANPNPVKMKIVMFHALVSCTVDIDHACIYSILSFGAHDVVH